LALVLAVGGPIATQQASAAEFQGGPDDPGQVWENRDNWVGATLPASGDDATIDNGTNAIIFDSQSETTKTLEIDGSVNVQPGGSLTVTDGVTTNGGLANDGTVHGANTVTVTGGVNNHGEYDGALDNSGVVYNEAVDGGAAATWAGSVTNSGSGSINNDGGSWTGAVTANGGSISNDQGAHWTGAVTRWQPTPVSRRPTSITRKANGTAMSSPTIRAWSGICLAASGTAMSRPTTAPSTMMAASGPAMCWPTPGRCSTRSAAPGTAI